MKKKINKKQLAALFLSFVMIFNLAAYEGILMPSFVAMAAVTPDSEDQDPDIYNDLLGKGYASRNFNGLYLNTNVYERYGVVAYTQLNELSTYGTGGNPKKIRQGEPNYNSAYAMTDDGVNYYSLEYRRLGENKTGGIINNQLFPNDADSGRPASQKNWFIVDKDVNIQSWESVGAENKDVKNAQVIHLLTQATTSDGRAEGSMQSILGKTGDAAKAYINLQSAPTLHKNGVMEMWHRASQSDYYQSFMVPALNWAPNNETNIKIYNESGTEQNEFTFNVDEDTLTFYVEVSSTMKFNRLPSGLSMSDVYSEVEQTLNGETRSVTYGGTDSSTKVSFPMTISKGDYTIGETATLPLKADSNYINVFDDELTSEAVARVTINNPVPEGLTADFVIKHGSNNVTSGFVELTPEDFEKDIPLKLEDKSVSSYSTIENYAWFYLDQSTGNYRSFSTQENPTFTITSANRDKVLDSEGNIEFQLKISDSFGESAEAIHYTTCLKTEKPIPPQPVNLDPVAKLSVSPKIVKAGDKVKVSSFSSYDPDGYLVSRDIDFSGYLEMKTEKSGTGVYLDYTEDSFITDLVGLTVVDNKGAKGWDEKNVTVMEPLDGGVAVLGTPKVNRQVILSDTGVDDSYYYRVDRDLTEWTIEPMEGQSTSSIKLKTDLAGGEVEALFKEPGKYLVKMKVKAPCTYQYEEWRVAEKEFGKIMDIKPDDPPITKLSVQSEVLRDPENDAIATIKVKDSTASTDGDYIASRKWQYRYDSDNDGNFSDEDWITLTSQDDEINIMTPEVGKYEFRLEVVEGFGQPTILEFINPSDYLTGNTDGQEQSQKISEVINTAPVVGFDMMEKVPVDMVVVTDYVNDKRAELDAMIANLEKEFGERNMELTVTVVDHTDSINMGIIKVPKFIYSRFLKLFVTYGEKYEHIYSRGGETFKPFTVVTSKSIDSKTLTEEEGRLLPTYPGSYGTATWSGKTEKVGETYTKYFHNFMVKVFNDPGGFEEAYSGLVNYESLSISVGGNMELKNRVDGSERVEVEESYSKGRKDGEVETDYNVINLESIKDVELKDGSVRYALFVTDDTTSLDYLNEDIAGYLRDNDFTVKIAGDGELINKAYLPDIVKIAVRKNPYSGNDYYYLLEDGRVMLVNNSITNEGKFYEDVTDTVDKSEIFVDYYISYEGFEYEYIAASKQNVYETTETTKLGGWRVEPEDNLYGEKSNGSQWQYVDYPNPDRRINYRGKGTRFNYKYSLEDGNLMRENSLYGSTGIYQENVSRLRTGGANFIIYDYIDSYGRPVNELKINNQLSGSFRSNDDEYELRFVGTIYQGCGSSSDYYNTSHRKFEGKYEFGSIYSISTPLKYTDYDEGRTSGGSWPSYREGIEYVSPEKYIYFDNYGNFWTSSTSTYERFETQSTAYRGNASLQVDSTSGGPSYTKFSDHERTPVKILTQYRPEYAQVNYAYVLYDDGTFVDRYTAYENVKDFYIHNATVYILYNDGTVSQGSSNYELETEGELLPEYEDMAFLKISDLIGTPRDQLFVSYDLESIKNSIIDEMKDYETSGELLLTLGAEVETTTFYSDYESDPQYESKWTIDHDPNYFENSLGKDPKATGESATPFNVFNYVGVYTIQLAARDNPKSDPKFDEYKLWNKNKAELKVIVHREPEAIGKISVTDNGNYTYNINLTDKDSYDLDHISTTNNGIVAYEWSYRKQGDVNWTTFNGKTTNIYNVPAGTTYFINLRVKDKEGVWSDYYSEEVQVGNYAPLYLLADAKATKSTLSLQALPASESMELYNISTEYPGDLKLEAGLYKGDVPVTPLETINYQEGVTGTKNGIVTSWDDIKIPTSATLPDGNYILKLKAVDVDKSDRQEELSYSVKIRTPVNLRYISPVELDGELDVNRVEVNTSNYTERVTMTAFVGQPFETVVPMILDRVQGDRKYWRCDLAVGANCPEGYYDLLFRGVTTNGNEEVMRKTLYLNQFKITISEIWGDWHHWRGQIDLFGKLMEAAPYRFLSYEKIHFRIVTSSISDDVWIRLSPELESMVFRDDYGNRYDYEDKVGKAVHFPLYLDSEDGLVWTGSYILPLAESTVDWEDDRRKSPYWAFVYARKGERVETVEFSEENGNGIDVTGNIYDLIYVQPAVE